MFVFLSCAYGVLTYHLIHLHLSIVFGVWSVYFLFSFVFFLFYFCASPVIFHCLACTARRVRTHTSGSHIPDDEIRHAEDKFAESLQLAQIGMFNLLDNDVSELCTYGLY